MICLGFPTRPVGAGNTCVAMKTLFTLLVLCSCAATAMAQGFGARCNTLASETRIQVLFDDRPAARDDSRSLDELRRLSQSATSPYHRVLGLTQAEPTSHLEVKVHVAEPVAERAFGEWAMLHDPAATWIWTQTEVADGAVDRATPEEVTGFFLRLSGVAAAYGDG